MRTDSLTLWTRKNYSLVGEQKGKPGYLIGMIEVDECLSKMDYANLVFIT